jgi:hypothetical protein
MRYELRLTAYDMMEDVLVSVELFERGDKPKDPTERVLGTSVQFRGTGSTEATAWIRTALERLLQDL